jgi:hypothetical protein
MKILLATAVIALTVFLGLETRETAIAKQISLTCVAAVGESLDCVSFGPLGAVKPSGVRFWVATFIDHGVEVPRTLGDAFLREVRFRSL